MISGLNFSCFKWLDYSHCFAIKASTSGIDSGGRSYRLMKGLYNSSIAKFCTQVPFILEDYKANLLNWSFKVLITSL